MFEVIATGKNENYGLKGEKRLMSDNHTLVALKNGWITDNFKWVGREKTAQNIRYKEELMPISRINAERTLESQLKSLLLIKSRIDSLVKVNKELLRLVKELP